MRNIVVLAIFLYSLVGTGIVTAGILFYLGGLLAFFFWVALVGCLLILMTISKYIKIIIVDKFCSKCNSRHVVKNGKRKDGRQRYICRVCGRQFYGDLR